MYIFLIIIHVISCLVLILVVLLQAGRGGGFSEMLGGGQPQSLFGTQTNAFMTRATEVCAVVFIITSLSLGIMSTQRGKSLVEKRRSAQGAKTAIPRIPGAASKAGIPATAVPASVPAAAGKTEIPGADFGTKPTDPNKAAAAPAKPDAA